MPDFLNLSKNSLLKVMQDLDEQNFNSAINFATVSQESMRVIRLKDLAKMHEALIEYISKEDIKNAKKVINKLLPLIQKQIDLLDNYRKSKKKS
mgnify:FL=1